MIPILCKLAIFYTGHYPCTQTMGTESKSYRPKNCSQLKLALTSPRVCISYLAHYPVLATHLGKRGIYNTLGHEYSWPRMHKNTCTTGADCKSCVLQDREPNLRSSYACFQHFRPLEGLGMDILGPLPNMKFGKQDVIALTDR